MLSWERPADAGELRSLLRELPEDVIVLPTGAPPPPDGAPAESGSANPAGAAAPGAGDAPIGPGALRADSGDVDAELLAVSTADLAGIRELAPGELTVTVGSGTRLDALQDELAEAGTWLALGCRALARSAGGAVAAALPGPWVGAYGDLPRQVLAVRVVTLGGTEARWGRAVMKNVAGYDVRRLTCGSRGRLGVLTEVSFRLWPGAPARARCRLASDAGALALAGRMIEEGADAGFRPDAVVWSVDRRSREDGTGVEGTLEVRFRGAEGSVRARRDALDVWAGDVGAEVETAGREAANGETAATGAGAGGDAETPPADRRTTELSVISVRTGRRGFVEAARRLSEASGPDLEVLEGYPLQGGIRCVYRNGVPASARDLEPDAPLARILEATDVPVRVERGLAAELAAVGERRDPAVREAEERVVRALEGGPGHWLSAYV